MAEITRLSDVYNVFFSKITDDLYMELTYEDTVKMVEELLKNAIPWFEFPRVILTYKEANILDETTGVMQTEKVFEQSLSEEEINIIATYMVVEWLGQQLATIELVRMKYSGADFKFTSQANHLQKLVQLKKEYERVGFHLQRLYKRRKKDKNGNYVPTMGDIMRSSVEERERRLSRRRRWHGTY